MLKKIVFWDNDGTVLGSKDPEDQSTEAKKILPNVKEVMQNSLVNVMISGIRIEDEDKSKDFDLSFMVDRFISLMKQLPITAAAFSPKRHGIECYLVCRKKSLENDFLVTEAHKEKRYQEYVGKFKKPDIGMFEVMLDFIKEHEYKILTLNNIAQDLKKNIVMIGDMPQDEKGAVDFGIDFVAAKEIHKGNFTLKN